MSKYHSTKVVCDGIKFDSKKEARRYQELKLLERAGVIKDLQLQQRFEILPKHGKNRAVFYVADFVYVENGKKVVEDCKGYRTAEYKLKKKMFEYRYDMEILET